MTWRARSARPCITAVARPVSDLVSGLGYGVTATAGAVGNAAGAVGNAATAGAALAVPRAAYRAVASVGASAAAAPAGAVTVGGISAPALFLVGTDG